VVHVGVGINRVAFDRDVTQCYWLGNVGLPGNVGSSAHGYVTTVGDKVDPNGVFVKPLTVPARFPI
jgi:hypothetical protein